MDELASLAKQLATVQAAASVYKLSEPNVVEVVQKLKELGLIEVLFTTNGKEYVTPKQLSNEVEDELLAHGGRVNLTDLPTLLNIDLTHIRAVDGPQEGRHAAALPGRADRRVLPGLARRGD